MDDNFQDHVTQILDSHLMALAPPQDSVPVSRQNGECVPQRRYEKGAGRGLPTSQDMVVFVRQDGSYIPVSAALGGDYTGLLDRDLPALPEAGYTITLRFEWPGYPSREFQLRTYDWCNPPKRVSLGKLTTEVGKIVQNFIEKMQEQAIAPEHERWRVGPTGIRVEHLCLAALEQVSAGTWQSRLFCKPWIWTLLP